MKDHTALMQLARDSGKKPEVDIAEGSGYN